MKKTKKTMLTSAILSAALAAQGENILASPVKVNSSAAPVYGPPPAAGDLNYDGRVDIADYVMLKSKISENGYSYNGDVNKDGNLDAEDAEQFRSFMFGLTDSLEEIKNNDNNIQTTYGPPVSVRPEIITTTTNIMTYPVYGPPPATEPYETTTEPVVSEIPSEEPMVTTTVTSAKKPHKTTNVTSTALPTEITTVVYGPPSAVFTTPSSPATEEISKIPETMAQLVYGPPPAFFTTPEIQDKEPIPVTEETVQVVYGPPSYFLGEDEVK